MGTPSAAGLLDAKWYPRSAEILLDVSGVAYEVDVPMSTFYNLPSLGERVVLLTEQPDATRTASSAYARSRSAAELMVPAEVRVVRAVPLLGSGKTDFAAVRRMAEAADAAPAVEHAV